MASKASVQEVAQRRYWREGEAQVVVEAWRRSGETLRGFAGRHGVDPGRLSRWARRLEGGGEGSLRFHPVRVVTRGEQRGGGEPIEIQLVGGLRVRVPGGFAVEDLRRVLSVLSEAGPC